MSGGSWSTAEGRAILAHFRGGRPDLASNSMGRILDPYAKLFKLDNPIAHQGCGPGMYSQQGSGLSNKDGVPILDVGACTHSPHLANAASSCSMRLNTSGCADIFGIPAAFLHGLFGYSYGSEALVLQPTLPQGVSSLEQLFPVRFGNVTLYLSMSGAPRSLKRLSRELSISLS